MSHAIRLSPAFKSLHQTEPLCFPRDLSCRTAPSFVNRGGCLRKVHLFGGYVKALTSHSDKGSSGELDSLPVSINLEPIVSESQFDRVVAEAQQLEESVVIVWMASWCRKCIYLKPKLEKLAADYYPRIGFYCIDVNNVPHMLVVRAGVTKMPTIQLWKDSKKQAEVIGGHKAHLVINEGRRRWWDGGSNRHLLDEMPSF